jgi:hypothetical protein
MKAAVCSSAESLVRPSIRARSGRSSDFVESSCGLFVDRDCAAPFSESGKAG